MSQEQLRRASWLVVLIVVALLWVAGIIFRLG